MSKKNIFVIVVLTIIIVMFTLIESIICAKIIFSVNSESGGVPITPIDIIKFMVMYIPQLIFFPIALLAFWILKKRKDLCSIFIASPGILAALFIVYDALLVQGYGFHPVNEEVGMMVYIGIMRYFSSFVTFLLLCAGILLGVSAFKEKVHRRTAIIGATVSVLNLVVNICFLIAFGIHNLTFIFR